MPAPILAIDIGGSHLKASVLDTDGNMLAERVRIDTPIGAHPDEFVKALALMVAPLPAYECIAVGFPGMVRDNIVRTGPLLDHAAWRGYPLAEQLAKAPGKPCRLGNDADVQGFAVIEGKGLEMVITLGTGFGAALFLEGRPLPTLELGHHPFHKGGTYEDRLGDQALKKDGKKKWNRRLARAIRTIRALTCFDALYIGGGNARHVTLTLAADTTTIDNANGVKGGVALWLGVGAG